jgi:hypothetical protein
MILITVFVLTVGFLYWLIGYRRILERYLMFFKKEYWTDYNTVEFAAWMAKALIIVPGLVFGKEIWWLHFFTLITSSLLIWASMRKSLPTLIAFNTLWIGISLTIILRNIL